MAREYLASRYDLLQIEVEFDVLVKRILSRRYLIRSSIMHSKAEKVMWSKMLRPLAPTEIGFKARVSEGDAHHAPLAGSQYRLRPSARDPGA